MTSTLHYLAAEIITDTGADLTDVEFADEVDFIVEDAVDVALDEFERILGRVADTDNPVDLLVVRALAQAVFDPRLRALAAAA